jgi:hypothetical protein
MIEFKINGETYAFPSTLREITLQRRVDFQKQHGDALKKELKRVAEIKNDTLRDLEFTVYHSDFACRSVAFYGGVPLDIIRNTSMDDVFAVYNAVTNIYSEETDFSKPEHVIQHDIEWKGELWEIAPAELKQDSTMSFGEVIDSKQIVQNIYDLSEDRWESLLYLCCVFLRKKGEPYSKLLAAEGSPRLQIMRELPLDLALNVGFFLTGLIGSYLSFSRSFSRGAPKEAESQ